MLKDNDLRAYKELRVRSKCTPAKALELVRKEIAQDGKTKHRCIEYSVWPKPRPNITTGFNDGDRVLCLEDPEKFGLRFVGVSDDLNRYIDHNGWFIDQWQDDVCRGVVYQLPTKGKTARFLIGYADPYNSDKYGRGMAILSPEICEFEYTDKSCEYSMEDERANFASDCAEWADTMAKNEAEHLRDHDNAYQLGKKAAERMQEAKEALAEFREHAEGFAVCMNAIATVKDPSGFWKLALNCSMQARSSYNRFRAEREAAFKKIYDFPSYNESLNNSA